MERIDPWQRLTGHCASEVLSAPKTWGDPLRSEKAPLPPHLEGIVTYLLKHAVGHPWANHLVLLAGVLVCQPLQHKTMMTMLGGLHRGFHALFPALRLTSMSDWEMDKHMTMYLSGRVLEEETPNRRANFWSQYLTSTTHLKRWLASLPQSSQELYRKYVLPSPLEPRELSVLSGKQQVILDQQEKRKAETDALMPFYMDLRTQAHLRYNLLMRLRKAYHKALVRKAYHKALEEVKNGKATLPLEFELRERGHEQKHRAPTERLLFRLWDRRTFVLAHAETFCYCTRWNARKAQGAFSSEKNTYLLEFVRAEALTADTPVVGLWFLELLEHEVVGGSALRGTPEEKDAKQTLLKAWGYAEENEKDTAPFVTNTSGVLSSPLQSGDSIFLESARRKTGAIFIPLEPFVTAATIGMIALHIITANGMRINELLQLRASTECIIPLVLHPAPDAENHTPSVHWEARVIPKGHSKPKPYYFDDEHLRLLSLLKLLLCERYGINPQTRGDLPRVPFRGRDPHRFPTDRYLFQYDHKGLTQTDVRASMRFLVHGLVFRTLDGRKVTVLPHLLRHGFATWALNVAKEPVDIVAAILNQKNLVVTKYYGRPNPRLIAERSHGLMAQIASYIDVDELILRSPEEIQQMLLQAQKSHGTLAHVRGGRCLLSGECPVFFACIGCAAKAPDPAQRGEVEETRQITLTQIERAKKKGLSLEVIQLTKKLKQCDAELREMEMIELCREDEQREPEVNFEIDV